MNYKSILGRLTGISCPVFGVSWNPPQPEINTALGVIRFLEDRRVLYNIYDLEIPEHCVQSVLEIRKYLTSVLCDKPDQEKLSEQLQAMRAACRRFLDTVQQNGRRLIIQNSFEAGPQNWTFFSALGELRASIGLHLGAIAVMNGLEVKGDLVNILPPPPSDE